MLRVMRRVTLRVMLRVMLCNRDHTTQEGLDHIKQMNALYLQGTDMMKAAMAFMTKTPAEYSKL